MKRSNPFQKHKERLLKRWIEEDYPGGTPRFQLALLAKDIVVFCLIPISAIIFYKVVESSISAPTKSTDRKRAEIKIDRMEKHSQIISFQGSNSVGSGNRGFSFPKRAPGTLVKVRLMNVLETFSNTPVHVQIMDQGLGREFIGATIIGDASPENSTGRVTMNFKFVRHPRRLEVAVPISARALSLDGTYGVNGSKKEGLFARAAIRSAANNPNSVDAGADNGDFKTLVARAVAAGLMQEFQSEASTAHNRAQVLTLKPMTEFFVELTDYFPGQN
ncbi:MAG: hypothetical protein J0L82_19620 [Deltaproteobacteria bacterium]|jgi:hypothetical protein|nr:hypothetical protein [Deltaproteobacteria bacterium]